MRTQRLALRPPRADDAQAIFTGFAADEAVTRYVAWPRHTSLEDTRAFLRFAQEQWRLWPAGPLVIESVQSGELIGATGLAFEAPCIASTGYVLGRRFWGQGYASEALAAVLSLAQTLGVQRLYALCHADHRASLGVLERGNFRFEALLPRHAIFPNLGVAEAQDVRCFVAVDVGQGTPYRQRPPQPG